MLARVLRTLDDSDFYVAALTFDSVRPVDLPAPTTAAPTDLSSDEASGIDLPPKLRQRGDALHEQEVEIHSARQPASAAFARISLMLPAK
jgi:hypothetical protein